MQLKPLHDNILVERVEQEQRTAGGLLLPETAQEKPQIGKVLAVGSGKKLENGTVQSLDLKVGDKVLFSKWGGTEVKLDGKDVLIMKETDILGIVS